MVKVDRSTWKANYFVKLIRLLDEYPKMLIVGVDNVGSKQMQSIRIALRGRAELLMGKNTMIRKAIRGHLSENPQLEKLLPLIKTNMGFVFTNEDLGEICKLVRENKVQAPARAGAIAPVNVIVPKGNTGMGPEKTSFFQALQIPTKIARGTIEIINDVNLISVGDKVGASEATLLNMLNVSPFSYGLEIRSVFDDGSVYGPEVLDITAADMIARFQAGVRNIAAVSLAIGYPTAASAPHSIVNGFKNALAIACATEITFPQAESAKAYLADPTAFAVAAAPTEEKKDDKKEEKKEESEESEDDDMGFGLFD